MLQKNSKIERHKANIQRKLQYISKKIQDPPTQVLAEIPVAVSTRTSLYARNNASTPVNSLYVDARTNVGTRDGNIERISRAYAHQNLEYKTTVNKQHPQHNQQQDDAGKGFNIKRCDNCIQDPNPANAYHLNRHSKSKSTYDYNANTHQNNVRNRANINAQNYLKQYNDIIQSEAFPSNSYQHSPKQSSHHNNTNGKGTIIRNYKKQLNNHPNQSNQQVSTTAREETGNNGKQAYSQAQCVGEFRNSDNAKQIVKNITNMQRKIESEIGKNRFRQHSEPQYMEPNTSKHSHHNSVANMKPSSKFIYDIGQASQDANYAYNVNQRVKVNCPKMNQQYKNARHSSNYEYLSKDEHNSSYKNYKRQMKHDGGTGNVTIDENQYGTYNNNKNNNNNSSKYSYEICEQNNRVGHGKRNSESTLDINRHRQNDRPQNNLRHKQTTQLHNNKQQGAIGRDMRKTRRNKTASLMQLQQLQSTHKLEQLAQISYMANMDSYGHNTIKTINKANNYIHVGNQMNRGACNFQQVLSLLKTNNNKHSHKHQLSFGQDHSQSIETVYQVGGPRQKHNMEHLARGYNYYERVQERARYKSEPKLKPLFSFNCNSQPSYNSTSQNALLPSNKIDDNAINVSKEYYQNSNISKYSNQEPAVGQKSQVSKDKSNKCANLGKQNKQQLNKETEQPKKLMNKYTNHIYKQRLYSITKNKSTHKISPSKQKANENRHIVSEQDKIKFWQLFKSRVAFKDSQLQYNQALHKSNKFQHEHLIGAHELQKKMRGELIEKVYSQVNTCHYK